MEDVITAAPPPSRFFPDDLDVFVRPPPPTPPPFVVLPSTTLSNPTLLLVASSASSLHVLLSTPLVLAGTLIQPDLPISSSSSNLYTVPSSPGALLLALRSPVPPERARAIAAALFAAIVPERVLILDSIRSGNFRGRLSVDEAMAFKLETAEQRRSGDGGVVGVDYLPSGSVMDGVGAALLGECEMRRRKATLIGTWPDKVDAAVVGLVRSSVGRLLPELLAGSEVNAVAGIVDDTDLLYA